MSAPEYRLEITAANEDVDVLGHISNLVFVRWILEVATAHSDARDWDHAAYLRLGAVWVVRKHEVEYLRSVYGGERIALVTWVDSWKNASCVRKTSIRRVEDDVEVARGSTLWAMVNAETGRPMRIDAGLRKSFV